MKRTDGDMVQIHALTAYPASLLNRDDAGLAKRVPFGGATRTRISSQCLKKHWRETPLIKDLGDLAVRSTRIYERLVARPLVDDQLASEQEAVAVASWLMQQTVNTKPATVKDGEVLSATRSGQLLVLTRAETNHLQELARDVVTSLREKGVEFSSEAHVKKHQDALDEKQLRAKLRTLQASLDTALFGRMVTSDLYARVDSAVSVAHAFTTHAEAAESDYFTAVDTLKDDPGDQGAGLIQDTELTSGVFYLYAVIDMEQLRQNLVGHDESLAERLATNLVEAIATVSPGAKRGSTAPYSYAEFLLAERGTAQPRTLANAFLNPVGANGAGLMGASVGALLDQRTRLATMYGDGNLATLASTVHPERVEGVEVVPFDELLQGTFATSG